MKGYILRLNKEGKEVKINVSIHGGTDKYLTIYINSDESFLMNDGKEYTKDTSFDLTVTQAWFDIPSMMLTGFMEIRYDSTKHIWKDSLTFYPNMS